MSPVLTAAVVVTAAVTGYVWGRWARSSEALASSATADVLAGIERRLARLEQDRAAATGRRRAALEARRHYEALADEVARERRLAEYQARATGTDSAGARVVSLPIRPAPLAPVRRYGVDQRA